MTLLTTLLLAWLVVCHLLLLDEMVILCIFHKPVFIGYALTV